MKKTFLVFAISCSSLFGAYAQEHTLAQSFKTATARKDTLTPKEYFVKAGRNYNRALLFVGISGAVAALSGNSMSKAESDQDRSVAKLGFGISGAFMVVAIGSVISGNNNLILAGKNWSRSGLALKVDPAKASLCFTF